MGPKKLLCLALAYEDPRGGAELKETLLNYPDLCDIILIDNSKDLNSKCSSADISISKEQAGDYAYAYNQGLNYYKEHSNKYKGVIFSNTDIQLPTPARTLTFISEGLEHKRIGMISPAIQGDCDPRMDIEQLKEAKTGSLIWYEQTLELIFCGISTAIINSLDYIPSTLSVGWGVEKLFEIKGKQLGLHSVVDRRSFIIHTRSEARLLNHDLNHQGFLQNHNLLEYLVINNYKNLVFNSNDIETFKGIDR